MELALAWCREGAPAPPAELLAALSGTPLRDFAAVDAFPEWETPLDKAKGGTRNHDLLAVGWGGDGRPGVVGIEAKAGEPFGNDALAAYLDKNSSRAGSRIPYRIALLVEAVTGQSLELPRDQARLDAALGQIGYQLFTATVGTVIEAGRRNVDCAVMAVHEFVSSGWSRTRLKNQVEAHRQLSSFIEILRANCGGPPGNAPLSPGAAVGPFQLHATEFCPGGVDLYICHVVTDLDGPRT